MIGLEIDPQDQVKRYPEYIFACLRKRRGLDEKDERIDDLLNKMDPNRVFHEVLIWHGLIGWDSQIKGWIKDIYKIDIGG